jgi:hypothetical protein
VKPRLREHHVLHSNPAGVVTGIEQLVQADVRINGVFFVFRRAILEAMEPDEDLVEQPFARLIERGAHSPGRAGSRDRLSCRRHRDLLGSSSRNAMRTRGASLRTRGTPGSPRGAGSTAVSPNAVSPTTGGAVPCEGCTIRGPPYEEAKLVRGTLG